MVHAEIAIPFTPNPCDLFARLRGLGSAVMLDSGSQAGWDIVAAQPDETRSLHIPATATDSEAARQIDSLKRYTKSAVDEHAQGIDASGADLPFHGGYIGHLSYELGRHLQGLDRRRDGALPLASVFYFSWAVVQDQRTQRAWLVSDGSVPEERLEKVRSLVCAPAGPRSSSAIDFALDTRFGGPWDVTAYGDVFSAVKRYIQAGDCYQINIGQDFSAPYRGDLLPAYRWLRDVTQAPYSAFLPLDDEHSLLCLSPERFLEFDKGRVSTKPIKGTRPRHADPDEDARAARDLVNSDKERAENLMIVDLLRNDIGRYCETGSVSVDKLFALESYQSVHHLVSTVSGNLRKDTLPMELLLGCLPGGSITGAPKHRAMQIIDELETAARQAWCGTVFYLSNHGRMDSNITIRSLYNAHGRLHCWAGGGLVDDSCTEAEFAEQRHKVGAMLDSLERRAGLRP
ncbi:MAG: aminodeoxychorismate synthase component I [Congregibacter sp.]